LSASSRVIAVGKAGQAVADVLLGCREPLSPDSQYRHDKLVVLHLGSHIVDEGAITAALEIRPQIVVLSQPASTDEPWARLFTEIVGSDALRQFRGALVFCVDHEEAIPSGLCQTSWLARGGRMKVEEVCVGRRVVDDVCEKVKTDNNIKPVIAQITDLFQENFHDAEKIGSTDLKAMAEFEDSTVASLLVEDAAGTLQVAGFCTYKYEPTFRSLYLARIAVNEELRGRGHASYMVRWCMAKSKQMGGAVSLHARPAIQSVALKLGFEYLASELPDGEFGERWMVWRERPGDLSVGMVGIPPTSRKCLRAARKREFKKNRR